MVVKKNTLAYYLYTFMFYFTFLFLRIILGDVNKGFLPKTKLQKKRAKKQLKLYNEQLQKYKISK